MTTESTTAEYESTESWIDFYEHFSQEDDDKPEDYYEVVDWQDPTTMKGWDLDHCLEIRFKVVDGLFDHLESLGYQAFSADEIDDVPPGEWVPDNYDLKDPALDFVRIVHDCPAAWIYMSREEEFAEIHKWLGIDPKYIDRVSHHG